MARMAGRFRLLVLLMFLVVWWSVVMLVYYARGAEQRQAHGYRRRLHRCKPFHDCMDFYVLRLLKRHVRRPAFI